MDLMLFLALLDPSKDLVAMMTMVTINYHHSSLLIVLWWFFHFCLNNKHVVYLNIIYFYNNHQLPHTGSEKNDRLCK